MVLTFCFYIKSYRHCEVRSNPLHAKSQIIRDCFVLRNDGYLILPVDSLILTLIKVSQYCLCLF
jgi:hypothetical protein